MGLAEAFSRGHWLASRLVYMSTEYTLSFRVEAKSIDFDALDDLLGAVGRRRHLERKSRFATYQSTAWWEIEAERKGCTIFDSIDDAFSAFTYKDVASSVHEAVDAGYGDPYWWCGCFHLVSTSTTVLDVKTLELIGRSGSRFITNNFYSSGEPGDREMLEIDDSIRDDSKDLSGHRYRFRLSNGEGYQSEGAWGVCFEDFGKGLDSEIEMLADVMRGGDAMVRTFNSILCEHTQYAFDGGPVLRSEQADHIASLGLNLVILWKTGC